MMFSLAIFDKLTPGALTGGAKIAGTGTIASDGTVGPIGGIQQKLYGARDGGARWFLAPSANCNEVVGHVPDGLSVVKVSTFAEARSAVEAIAARQGRRACPGAPTCGRRRRPQYGAQSCSVALSACTSPGAMSRPMATRSSLSCSR